MIDYAQICNLMAGSNDLYQSYAQQSYAQQAGSGSTIVGMLGARDNGLYRWAVVQPSTDDRYLQPYAQPYVQQVPVVAAPAAPVDPAEARFSGLIFD